MSELSPAADEVTVSNPFARIVTAIISPSKAFADVKKNSGWWAPFLLASVMGIVFGYVLVAKIGIPALVDGAIHQSTRLQDQLASATPDTAAKIRRQISGQFKFYYVAPVFSLVIGLMSAGVLLAGANFGAGGKATYKQMLGVWFYGTLPLTVFYLLVIAGVFGGAVSDPFNMNNAIGTNPGFYMSDSDLPKMVIALLSSIDLFAIWTAVTLTIGVSIVAEIKRGAAAAVVLGGWVLVILLKVAGAAFG
jgi:hypothetical protein